MPKAEQVTTESLRAELRAFADGPLDAALVKLGRDIRGALEELRRPAASPAGRFSTQPGHAGMGRSSVGIMGSIPLADRSSEREEPETPLITSEDGNVYPKRLTVKHPWLRRHYRQSNTGSRTSIKVALSTNSATGRKYRSRFAQVEKPTVIPVRNSAFSQPRSSVVDVSDEGMMDRSSSRGLALLASSEGRHPAAKMPDVVASGTSWQVDQDGFATSSSYAMLPAEILAKETTDQCLETVIEDGVEVDDGESDDDYELKRRLTGFRKWAFDVTRHSLFEMAIGCVVMANAVTLGFEADFQKQRPKAPMPAVLQHFEMLFCVVFCLELALRLYAHRLSFFCNSAWAWNWFDLSLVSLQLIDQFMDLVQASSKMNVSALRLFRLLRLLRITRLLRVVRLVEELHTIVNSVAGSLKSLSWALLLMFGLIYSTSVCFLQVIAQYQDELDSKHFDDIQHFYGSLPRTMLTLFECVTGGLNWDKAMLSLTSINPIMVVPFTAYIAFCVFAVLNVVTGVFVDKASEHAKEDRDNAVAQHISHLFFSEEASTEAIITWEKFEQKLSHPDMKDYFKKINVDVSEARGFFQLLDVDGSGSLDSDEVVSGFMRLRGGAKAVELALLMQHTQVLNDRVDDITSQQLLADRRMAWLVEQVAAMSQTAIPSFRRNSSDLSTPRQ